MQEEMDANGGDRISPSFTAASIHRHRSHPFSPRFSSVLSPDFLRRLPGDLRAPVRRPAIVVCIWLMHALLFIAKSEMPTLKMQDPNSWSRSMIGFKVASKLEIFPGSEFHVAYEETNKSGG
ncbi:hypothetical protein L2E82_24471 [Cichorium intybus]|uniref:Uncharacterized protein n=1 Tax=Cichorium intybus TaxID=13427 RepID=A0ACB9E0A7_CICIN|nr:hypothetical protein L2E82_24471 [Cichorium intybus]